MNPDIEKQLRSLGIFTLISARQIMLLKDIISSIENSIYVTGRTKVHLTRPFNAEEDRYMRLYLALMDMEIVGGYELAPDGKSTYIFVEHVIERDHVHGLGASPYRKI